MSLFDRIVGEPTGTFFGDMWWFCSRLTIGALALVAALKLVL